MSALDALACGTPILISMKQGIKDVIIEDETGFTLENETPEELAQTLISLSRRKNELRDKKEIIRNSVSHLNWDNAALKLREIYLSLIH